MTAVRVGTVATQQENPMPRFLKRGMDASAIKA
ncbi:MAG: hypothetical protein QOG17_3341, partial [Gammaproteobacteria bacterium]|nr:hypothetical protein [Gammaproteobacteria bacterium]